MKQLEVRIREIIENCWNSFCAKVGGELIVVNKEASMQLQFAYLLKNTVDLALHHNDEEVNIELETGVRIGNRMRECDIVIELKKGKLKRLIPIELKCYKYLAASGGKRGAVDIFVKDIYSDLELLENYSANQDFLPGIQFTMTDYRNIPFPPKRTGKYLTYDVTEGARIDNGIVLNTPIGGKDVNIILKGTYQFNWSQVGEFYFLKLENNE